MQNVNSNSDLCPSPKKVWTVSPSTYLYIYLMERFLVHMSPSIGPTGAWKQKLAQSVEPMTLGKSEGEA